VIYFGKYVLPWQYTAIVCTSQLQGCSCRQHRIGPSSTKQTAPWRRSQGLSPNSLSPWEVTCKTAVASDAVLTLIECQ